MRRTIRVACILLTVILSACGSKAAPTAIPTVVLDNSDAAPNQPASNANAITASAIVVPVREARLSFTSVGRVVAVNIKVGDQVKAGDVLVTLDTSILQAKVKEAEANLEAAQAQVRFLKRQKTDQVDRKSVV